MVTEQELDRLAYAYSGEAEVAPGLPLKGNSDVLALIGEVRAARAALADRERLLRAVPEAIGPVAHWARAVLAPRDIERECDLPDCAVLEKAQDVPLTAGALRDLIALLKRIEATLEKKDG